MNKALTKTEIEFLKQSNLIENERSALALEDAKKAYMYAKYFNKDWDINFILKVHKLLMKRLRPDIAGKLRDCDIWIGGHRKIFVSEALLKQELKTWISEIGKSAYYQTDVDVAINGEHIEFEYIHPFEDGNGRIGRILWQVRRLKCGLPILIIKDEEKYDYYKWFKDVS